MNCKLENAIITSTAALISSAYTGHIERHLTKLLLELCLHNCNLHHLLLLQLTVNTPKWGSIFLLEMKRFLYICTKKVSESRWMMQNRIKAHGVAGFLIGPLAVEIWAQYEENI